MEPEPGKPQKPVIFSIAYPNSCSLKYDPIDFKLRKMLEDSGIEPFDPEPPETQVENTETKTPTKTQKTRTRKTAKKKTTTVSA